MNLVNKLVERIENLFGKLWYEIIKAFI
jgi:hypothetical protein